MSMIYLRLMRTTSHAAIFVTAPAPPGGGDGTQWDFSFSENSGHLLTCGF
jgi:hypothetical protein